MTICTVTPNADKQISELCKENKCYAITLSVKGGGCAGFEYEWGTAKVEDLEPGDEVITQSFNCLFLIFHSCVMND